MSEADRKRAAKAFAEYLNKRLDQYLEVMNDSRIESEE